MAKGAVAYVVAALRNHVNVQGVSRAGMLVLEEMAHKNEAAKDAIIAAGAVDIISEVFRASDVNTQAWAHSALVALGFTADGRKMPHITPA